MKKTEKKKRNEKEHKAKQLSKRVFPQNVCQQQGKIF